MTWTAIVILAPAVAIHLSLPESPVYLIKKGRRFYLVIREQDIYDDKRKLRQRDKVVNGYGFKTT